MKQLQKIENLSDTSRKIIANYMIRKSNKQKTRFIDFLKNEFSDCNYNITVEKYDNKDNNRNIILGDIKKAKYIYTAHYDTCATLGFLPNFICPKNIFLFLLFQTLIGIILVAPTIVLAFLVQYLLKPYGETIALIGYEVTLLGLLFSTILIMFYGVPNKNNYNDNTSGVITLIEMIKQMPSELKEQTCFVFFDNEEKGLLGSKAFFKKHLFDGIEKKLLVNFDCVSEGDNLLFIHKNADEAIIKHINNYQEKAANKLLITSSYKKAIFPSDHKKFPNYIGVGAFNKKKGIGLYLGRIHTKRDIIFDEDNIFLLRDIFIDSLNKIS